jgi:hypothetical protein
MSEVEHTVRLLVTVLETESCDVAFEPEGAVVRLDKNDAFTVEVSGAGDGIVEVSYRSCGISIAAWSGARTTAWDRAGNRLRI